MSKQLLVKTAYQLNCEKVIEILLFKFSMKEWPVEKVSNKLMVIQLLVIYMARYRRNNSAEIIYDSIAITKKLHWKMAVVFGLVGFVVLYFIVPLMLPEPIAQTEAYQPLMDKIASKGQWFSEKLGIAVLIVFWFFALVNFWKESR